jgi:hypothetical protein
MILRKWLALLLMLGTALVAFAAPPQITPEQEKELFARVDEMAGQVSDILGMKMTRPVPRALISREKIREYVEQRMGETMSPEELHTQEVLLKKFGFLPPDYDLKAQMVDLLTEQAAAFYDYKKKRLFLASWMPTSMQDMALVHELAHAVADQHFSLEKFIQKVSGDDDASLARSAVVEGQASWVMTEYMARQLGQSLRDMPHLLEMAVSASRLAGKEYPVFGAAPPYLQQTLMFPYIEGMVFQQAVTIKSGRAAFTDLFRRPPVSTQQVLHPDLYFQSAAPVKLQLANPSLPSGYRKTMAGTIGELEHRILLQQYAGDEVGADLAPQWRAGRYALWENSKTKGSVLTYAVQWENEAVAAQYLARYRAIAGRKWKKLQVTEEREGRLAGRGDDGRFVWTLQGSVFTVVEGLPK